MLQPFIVFFSHKKLCLLQIRNRHKKHSSFVSSAALFIKAGFLFFTLLTLQSSFRRLYAQEDYQHLAQKIESRRGAWSRLSAELTISFITAYHQKAACSGEIRYNQRDEKLILSCFNLKKTLLFLFKIDEKNFEVYLPARQTVYKGNIFDLADSPEIESHLKPIDLYRGIKPAPLNPFKNPTLHFDKEYSELFFSESQRHPSRHLRISESGDIMDESYGKRGVDFLKISRTRFSRFQGALGVFYFPQAILISEKVENSSIAAGWNQTRLEFQKVKFDEIFDETTFNFIYPAGTIIETVRDNLLKN